MTDPIIKSLDRDVIESVLKMASGYVLDFSDRTFSDFFRDYGVAIDEPAFFAEGTSKAKRFRAFLKAAKPELAASILAALLERRLLKDPDGLKATEVDHYRALVGRLEGKVTDTSGPGAIATEDELLRRVFRPELIVKLRLDPGLGELLVGRMNEAHRCIETKAYLAAVVLCGSILEGLCLGVGGRQPERVNRAFAAQYNKAAPQFHEWRLQQWIEVLGRLGDLSPNVEKFGQALRDFRNYVHPAEQLARKFSPDQHTARIGFQVVVAAIEDLVRSASVGEQATP